MDCFRVPSATTTAHLCIPDCHYYYYYYYYYSFQQGPIQDLPKLGQRPRRARGSGALLGVMVRSPLKLKAFCLYFHTKEGPKVKDLNETI